MVLKTVALSLAALMILMGASQAFASTPATGTWKDGKLIFFYQATVGATTSITSETCGTITGTISGQYCDYRNTVINLATGIGTFSALDNCICNSKSGLPKSSSIISTEIGTITLLPNGIQDVNYLATIQKGFRSTVTSGSIMFFGTINPLTLLASGNYTGTIN